MPKKNTIKKPKKQRKNHNVKVKGKKNNVNQNNIHIKIGGASKAAPSYGGVSSTTFGYPVYMQSPLMQNNTPAQPAFGSPAAAPVSINTQPIAVPPEPVNEYINLNNAYNRIFSEAKIASSLDSAIRATETYEPYSNLAGFENPYESNEPSILSSQSRQSQYTFYDDSIASQSQSQYTFDDDSIATDVSTLNNQVPYSYPQMSFDNPYDTVGQTITAGIPQPEADDVSMPDLEVIPQAAEEFIPIPAQAEQLISNDDEDEANKPVNVLLPALEGYELKLYDAIKNGKVSDKTLVDTTTRYGNKEVYVQLAERYDVSSSGSKKDIIGRLKKTFNKI